MIGPQVLNPLVEIMLVMVDEHQMLNRIDDEPLMDVVQTSSGTNELSLKERRSQASRIFSASVSSSYLLSLTVASVVVVPGSVTVPYFKGPLRTESTSSFTFPFL
ncbi:hypothetical protein Tco_0428712 [Tanacetum coccineum]